jgi:hypothetical protein
MAETLFPLKWERILTIPFRRLLIDVVSSKKISSFSKPISSSVWNPAGAVMKQILLLGCCFRVSLIAGYATRSAPISAIRIKTMVSGGGMIVANVELESA